MFINRPWRASSNVIPRREASAYTGSRECFVAPSKQTLFCMYISGGGGSEGIKVPGTTYLLLSRLGNVRDRPPVPPVHLFSVLTICRAKEKEGKRGRERRAQSYWAPPRHGWLHAAVRLSSTRCLPSRLVFGLVVLVLPGGSDTSRKRPLHRRLPRLGVDGRKGFGGQTALV